CVYRLAQRRRNFGKTAIVDILHGSKGAKIRDAGLDTLSTYGIMADTGTKRIRAILDFLVEQGYLALESGEFPVVCLCERSEAVISRERPAHIEMMIPKEEKKAASKTFAGQDFSPSPLPLDEGLFARLKTLRGALAGAAHVPSYIIFSDAALRDMCRKKPQTKAAFLEVVGVGQVKLERYGDMFTREIRGYCEAAGRSP
ncbi:MAG: HRDC domain-containing protein, partial [Spirochaetaceae bacterium]|nr:HRDC domain-containing protein [Spirochaetaceae bacterium]